MNEHACRELAADWGDIEDNSRSLSDLIREAVELPRPSRTYSKRSAHIQNLRNRTKWAIENESDDVRAPTREAASAAEFIINDLPHGCLQFDLAISHGGEINMFFGDRASPFQVLITEDGLLSYFGIHEGMEYADSDIDPRAFPYMRLFRLISDK